MDPLSIDRFRHSHDFRPDCEAAETATRRVIWLCAAMMVVELGAGWRFHSMALTADGWHMGTHVAAFVITAGAYAIARRYRSHPAFSFGTGKVEVLGGYSSAIVLGFIALFMAFESAQRLFQPLRINFNEALIIGAVGLGVNVLSALLLRHDHSPGHGHSHGHGPAHGHDLNLRAAYVHVIADAVTSLLALGALAAGKYLGWAWMDPAMGLVGAVVIARWSWTLIRDTGTILLDRTPATDLPDEIRRAVESDGNARVADLHVWQLAPDQFSAIVSVVTGVPRSPDYYREQLRQHEELRHLTVEVNAP